MSQPNLHDLERLFELSVDLLCVAASDSTILAVNPAYLSAFGYTEKELLGRPFLSLIHPDDLEETIAQVSGAIQGETTILQEVRSITASGQTRWFQWSARADPSTGRIYASGRDVTTQHLDRERIQKYAAIVESTNDAVIGKTLDGIITSWNGGAEVLYGYSEDEVLGCSISIVIPPGHDDELPSLIDRIRQGEQIKGFETERITRDGKIIDVSLTVSPIRSGKQIIGASATARDITDRKRAEVDLRNSEERYRQIIQTSQEGIWVIDTDAKSSFVNERMASMLGYTVQEMMSLPLWDFIDEADRELTVQNLKRRSSGESGQHDFKFIRKDGTPLWTIVQTNGLRDETGRNIGVLAMVTDITERKHAEDQIRSLNAGLEERVLQRTRELELANRELAQREQALREAQEYLSHLMMASPVVIYRTSYRADAGDFPVTYISPNFQQVLGFASEDVMTIPSFLAEHLHPDDAERIRAAVRGAMSQKGAGALTQEFRILHQDGNYRWMSGINHFDIDANGIRIGMLGFWLDITDRKLAEGEIEAAKGEAERANQAKSEFLSRMSHELRTPLNAVLGFAELLDMDDRTADDHEALQMILKGGSHLLTLINDVLAISRIEEGQLPLSFEPVNLTELLAEVVSLIRPLALEHGVTITGPERTASFVIADQQRLKQVFLNLLSNAIKYNRPNGQIAISSHIESGDLLSVSVTDSGLGIAPALIERLFSPFDRLGAEQTEVEGTGLGLALSKRLVEAMHGTIAVESTVGHGSTFRVNLPLADDDDHSELSAESAALLSPTREQAHVLYIEDNLSNLKLIERILERRPGITLMPAMQGSIGLELARKHSPDLILLDMHLPDMQGDEVLQRLKGEPETRHIPVVMVSADAMPPHIERMLASGIRYYLTKPLRVAQFLSVLDEILDEAPQVTHA